MRKLLAISLLLLLLPLRFLPAAGETTLLLYMIGGDLERDSGAASADISEMLTTPAPEDLRIMVLTGGSPLWYLKGPSTEGASVFLLQGGELQQLDVWPEASCGSADTLARFLAEYAGPDGDNLLILWGHGHSGLDGIGPDLLHHGDLLTLPEMVQALSRQKFRLTAVGFDACEMATLEAAFLLQPYTDFLIASADAEPLSGWAYRAWLKCYTSDPAAWLAALRQETTLRWQRASSAATLTVLPLHSADRYAPALKSVLSTTPIHTPGCSITELSAHDPEAALLLNDWLQGQPLRTGLYASTFPDELAALPLIGDCYLTWLQRCPAP